MQLASAVPKQPARVLIGISECHDNKGHLCTSVSCPCYPDYFSCLQIVGAFERDGQKLPHTLTGKWDTSLEASMPDGTKQTIWHVHPLPADSSRSDSALHIPTVSFDMHAFVFAVLHAGCAAQTSAG